MHASRNNTDKFPYQITNMCVDMETCYLLCDGMKGKVLCRRSSERQRENCRVSTWTNKSETKQFSMANTNNSNRFRNGSAKKKINKNRIESHHILFTSWPCALSHIFSFARSLAHPLARSPMSSTCGWCVNTHWIVKIQAHLSMTASYITQNDIQWNINVDIRFVFSLTFALYELSFWTSHFRD